MNPFWFQIICTFTFLIPLSFNCPHKCVCVENTIFNCSKLGIVKFPPDTISVDSEDELTEFSIIDLSENGLIQADFPSTYKSFGKINLAFNEIGTMKNVSVSNVESLKELDLSHNKRLEKLTIDLKSKSLEILTIRNCSLTQVEEGFLESFPSLKLMDISENSLTEIGLLSPVFQSKNLDSEQEFTENFAAEKQYKLIHLNISHNKLVKMHGNSFRFTKIKILDISNNKISHLKFTIHLQHLEEFYASGNDLNTIDELSAPNLIRLDVSGNRIKQIHLDFTAKAPKLKILRMSRNHLEKLTKIKSSSILDLDFSYSRVRFIEPEAFSRLERLERLNLIGNELTNLQSELFSHGKFLRFVLLGENPWLCDCNSPEFRNLYKLVLFERYYSDGEDLLCQGEGNKTWSNACEINEPNEDLVLSERAAFYTLMYIFAALSAITIFVICYKCIRNLRQSDAISFENAAENNTVFGSSAVLNDNRLIPEEVDEERPPSFPMRRSTPPPNYEDALMLPVLTEEQKELAISVLSLHRLPDCS